MPVAFFLGGGMFTNDCCIIVKYLQGSAKTFLTGSSLAILEFQGHFPSSFGPNGFVSYYGVCI